MKTDTILAALHSQAPLVHCITNYVAMNIAANVVLAAGASPAMLHATEEVADFVPLCGALTINIGTLSSSWVTAMQKAADAANAAGKPWVLDPVAHFATPYRASVAQDLVERGPTIIRGNASEILALSGAAAAGKGADSGDSVADAQIAATHLAKAQGCVVAVTGEIDFVTDGTRSAHISGGCALMPKVTALGCSLTALMGAFASVAPPLEATVAALVMFAQAGAQAGTTAQGPGSFQVAFLDALSQIKPADLADDTRVQWL
ncbi:hydroxyethylthiazole kinase [Pacificibacter marinus]|uniref:Hydroxyethylthiazole kinase n=1 Tax=Pacificibacter marinus TaxID=658057 RepID=A0A1Y5R7L3_9RHOB|nr:hydroxyethylthiazole kinase [Pacificibacter marinus]SEK29354.1 hydroxyethylthiazole kinase [Pacificibacter marinus]SLN10368.1 Hydroxyethylthiazole kinase [Pacificibacter marinus]